MTVQTSIISFVPNALTWSRAKRDREAITTVKPDSLDPVAN